MVSARGICLQPPIWQMHVRSIDRSKLIVSHKSNQTHANNSNMILWGDYSCVPYPGTSWIFASRSLILYFYEFSDVIYYCIFAPMNNCAIGLECSGFWCEDTVWKWDGSHVCKPDQAYLLKSFRGVTAMLWMHLIETRVTNVMALVNHRFTESIV